MRLVYDASALLDRLPERARHAEAQALYRFAVRHFDLVSPSLITWELGNALLRKTLRRTKPSVEARTEAHADLLEFVRLARPNRHVLRRTMRLATTWRLTFYDASYLAVAEGAPGVLVTEDKRLLEAGRNHLGRQRALTAHDACQQFGAEVPP